jgi:hypothetical protein
MSAAALDFATVGFPHQWTLAGLTSQWSKSAIERTRYRGIVNVNFSSSSFP